MNWKSPLFTTLLVSSLSQLQAQNLFTNGGLEGTTPVATTPATLPSGWSPVLDTDPICQASAPLSATADIAGATGFPTCNPNSGTFCVSGLRGKILGGEEYHEGLKQTVSGLQIGKNYEIKFFQTVVTQFNANDPTGLWEVYVDNALLGKSAISTVSGTSTTRTWDQRTFTFTATLSTHTFKFLPGDDDADISMTFGTTGGVRMGIDDLELIQVSTLPVELTHFTARQKEESVLLNWSTASELNSASFTVEHSVDGLNWESIAVLEAAGNSLSARRYTAEHTTPVLGDNYYRLVQRDRDGSQLYSAIQHLSIGTSIAADMYPNPLFGQALNLVLDRAVEQRGLPCILYNAQGQGLSYTARGEGRTFQLSLDDLPAGLYRLKILIPGMEKTYTLSIR